jgi:2-polyprenyl-6-methoxyphenol hydroxylase-like FAD-dependent oxidoreductase
VGVIGRSDVVVVGGGLAGLTAALVAAGDGASVVVVDARSVGGRGRSVRRDGFVLNQGAHALYGGAGGRAVLEALGVRIAGSSPPLASYEMVWDGQVVPLPITPSTIADTALLGARSKAALLRWLSDITGAVEQAGGTAVVEWLEHQGAGPDLRRLIESLLRLTTLSASPLDAPARYLLPQLAAGGVVYVDCGWQMIVDELVGLCRIAGVGIVEHEPVTEVGDGADGWVVVTSRRQLSGRCVVMASGGPEVVTRLLGRDDAGWVEQAGPPQRVACLDIGTTSAPVAHPFLLSADEPLYVSHQAPVARLAPVDHALYSAIRYLDPRDRFTAADNRAALQRHCERAGIGDAGRSVLDRFLASSVVTWGRPQVGVDRPSGHELGSRGVFVAGDWIGDRLLADASILSGAAAGRAAARATVRL